MLELITKIKVKKIEKVKARHSSVSNVNYLYVTLYFYVQIAA